MNIKRKTLDTIPLAILCACQLLTTGCTTYGGVNNPGTYQGGMGTSLSTLGQIMGGIGSAVSPNSSKVWRQSSRVLNSTGNMAARQEAEARRQQQAYYEQQRRLQQQEQERQKLALMSPEEREAYKKQQLAKEQARLKAIVGMGCLMFGGCETGVTQANCQDKAKVYKFAAERLNDGYCSESSKLEEGRMLTALDMEFDYLDAYGNDLLPGIAHDACNNSEYRRKSPEKVQQMVFSYCMTGSQ